MALNRFPAVAVLVSALVVATQAPIASAASRTLVIGVDHADIDHPDPFQSNSLFEYTDFFSRAVRVRKGETLDFRTAPGAFHIVALTRNEQAARATYPVALLDADDPVATGSQHKKIELGPSNGPIKMGNAVLGGGQIGGANDQPTCGLVQMQQPACTFTGGNDLESQGGVAGFGATGPAAVDWQIVINAAPGPYTYFCFIHPGMRGKFTVVGEGEGEGNGDDAESVTTQAQIDRASASQFREDREDARDAERDANKVHFSGGAPGTRTYDVSVGVGASNNHVAINEMLPQHLNLDQGDKVVYHWRDPHNVHTVGFPTGPTLPPPFGPEFEPPAEPFELVGDPGNAPPGTLLTDTTALVDAGLFLGTGYHVPSTVQQWSVSTNGSTQVAAFAYQCTIHDFMHGTLNVSK